MNSPAVGNFENAINAFGFKPKGIKVGYKLYKLLKSNGKVEQKEASLGGVLDIGLKLPYLYGDIYVHIDSDLDDWGYEMPTSA